MEDPNVGRLFFSSWVPPSTLLLWRKWFLKNRIEVGLGWASIFWVRCRLTAEKSDSDPTWLKPISKPEILHFCCGMQPIFEFWSYSPASSQGPGSIVNSSRQLWKCSCLAIGDTYSLSIAFFFNQNTFSLRHFFSFLFIFAHTFFVLLKLTLGQTQLSKLNDPNCVASSYQKV